MDPIDPRRRRRRRPRDPADRGRHRDVRAARASPPASSATPRASRKPTRAASTGQGPISDLIAQSAGAREPQQGRRAARLRRQPGPRDRPRRPQAQASRVPRSSGPARIVGVPVVMFILVVRPPGARATRSSLLIGALIGFMLPRFWLNRRKNGRLNAVQQAAAGHDHPDRQRPAGRLLVPPGHRARRPRVAAADLDRVRPGHPRGQPRPAVRPGAREHGPPRPVGRPRADGHRHLDPAHGRRQPRRDPRLDRVHDPRARPHQGRDPHPDRAAAPVGLRRRLPADRPRRLPVHRRTRLHGADVREPARDPRPAGRRDHPRSSAGS